MPYVFSFVLSASLLCLAAGARATEPLVSDLPVPAAVDSGMYTLTTTPDGIPLLSWIEPTPPHGHALRFARLERGGWSAPRLVATGADWFVNWADRPSVVALPTGDMLAHWLVRSRADGASGAYGVRVARSTDGGATWVVIFEDHLTSLSDYAGFLSFVPDRDGVTAAYLRPHETAPAEAHVKTLAVVRIDGDGRVVSRDVVDADVCTCCPTAAIRTAQGVAIAYRDHAGEVRDISIIRQSPEGWSSPAPVHRDDWRISGCPVNGPALVAAGDRAAVAWFTAAQEQPRVQVAFADTTSLRFGPPRRVDDGQPIGWTGAHLLDDGSVVVSWLEGALGGTGEIRVRRLHSDGRQSEAAVVARSAAGRGTGMPQLAVDADGLVVAWRDGRVRAVRTAVPSLPATAKPPRVVEDAQAPSAPAQQPSTPPSAPPPDEPSAATPPTVNETVDVRGQRPLDRLSLDDANSTASRLSLTPRETPATVVIVDRAAIEERGALDTQEILNGVPGMTAASPPGSAGSVSYRGFGAAQLTQLFNGLTVQYDAIAARPVDSWIYERVEVIGGPSTFLFGAGAVGGSINYITKLATRARNSVDGRLAYGSYGTSEFSGGINRTARTGPLTHALRADGSRTDTSGYVDGTDRASVTAAASWRVDVDTRFSHTAALEGVNERADRVYWGTPLLTPATGVGRINPATRFTNYNSRDGVYAQEVLWARSLSEWKPSATVSVRNTLYHYDALRDYRNVEVYRYTPDNAAVIRSAALLQRHDQTLTGNRVESTWITRVMERESTWAFGLDVSGNRQTRFPRSLNTTVSVVDPLVFDTERFFDIPGMLPTLVPDRINRVRTLAVFAENETKLLPALSLVTALRHDRIDLEVTNQRTPTATDPALFERRYRPVTGRVGVSWALRPSANLYGQVSTAADPPAGILTTATFGQVRDFDLTTGRQVEVGAKIDVLGGRGAITAAAYRIVRENLAIPDPDNPVNTLPVGQQSSRGVEVAVALRPMAALAVQGHLSWTDAQYDDFVENVGGVAVSRAGNLPPNTPRGVAGLFATFTPTPAWQVGADWRYVSGRFANPANTVEASDYALVGAFAAWTPHRAATVQVRVRNATDAIYARALTGAPMFFLGAPRTFEIALRLSR